MAFRIFRRLQELLDVDDTGLGEGDVPTYATAVSKFTMAPPGAAQGHSVTLSGNTAGALALISTGTWTLAGGNGITLSQAGNAVTISGGAGGAETQTAISGVSASDTLYTSGTVRLTGVGGGITVGSNTGQRIDLSVAAPVAQSVQTQNLVDLTLAGNTAGALALASSGTVTLAGGNNVTLSQAGNAVTISAANQSVQPETQTFIAGVSASNTLYTSGNVRLTGVGGGVTVSSNTGQRVDISVAAQTVQTQNVVDMTLSGNTAGALALISSGTMTLAGGNNITVSQAGNAVTISGANVGGAQTGISGLANSQTTYTSGTVSLSELGAITIRSTTGNQFQFSVNAQSVQPETQTFIAGISASDTLYTSGNVRLTGVGGGVTVSSNTGQRVDISVAAQSVQPETQTFLSGVGNSQTTYTSGNVNLSVLAGNLTIRSTTGQAFQFSMSQSVQAETQTFIAGVSASDTLYTSGNVRITGVGGGITVSSNTGQRVDLSVAAQSVQTQNMVAVTLSGNTSGAQALISSGTLTLAGGNNITVSQAGNAVTISGPNVGGAQTGISGMANSETTYTSGTVSLSALGAITIRSTTGQQFQLSVNAQSVQPETQTFIAGVSASDTLYTSGNVRITGVGGGITVSSNTGQRIDLSVAAPVAQTAQTGISGIANSQTTYTSGTVSLSELGAITIRSTTGNQYQLSVNSQTTQTQGILSMGVSSGGNTLGNTQVSTGSRMVIVASGALTASQATAAGASTITLSAATQTVQTQNLHNVTLSGNTAGAMAQISSGTMTLAGGANVTLSQAGNAVTISAGGGAETQTAISGIANSQTTYTSGTVSFSELGAITVRSTTGNQFQFSVNAQSVQPETQTFIAGVSASDTLYTSGNVRITGVGGGITVGSSTGQRIDLSVAAPVAQSVQTQGGFASLGVSTGGNTAGNTQVSTGSRFVLVASGNATASQATAAGASTITISVGTQTVQTQNMVAVSASNTLYSSGTVLFTGSNMITVKSSGAGQTVILDATQSVQTQNLHNVTLSGNTAGAMAHISSGTMTLAGGNNITLSQAGNAVTISAGAGGGFSAGVSTGGNTAGATGVTGTRLVLVGTNNVTLSQTTDANGGTISISAAGAGAGQFSGGVSNLGNTAGSTGITGSQNVLVGSGVMSLSQSTGANGATITISAPVTSSLSATGGLSISTNGSTISIGVEPRVTLADWQNFQALQAMNMSAITAFSKTPFYWNDELPGRISANSFVYRMSCLTTATLQSFSAHLGIYTLVNSTSAALLGSLSESYVLSTASSASWSGIRQYVMTGIGTHTALSVMSQGEYMFGMMFSAGATGSMNYILIGAGAATAPFGVIRPGANQASTALSQGAIPLYGRGSTTVNAMPANVVASELINLGQGASCQLHPWIYIRS